MRLLQSLPVYPARLRRLWNEGRLGDLIEQQEPRLVSPPRSCGCKGSRLSSAPPAYCGT
jgi:hypothetical protein